MATGTTRRRTQPPEVRREQLLDAAAAVIVEKGFTSMTVADVAERAGVAKGTVYLYFDTKEHLVTGLQARYASALVDLARALNDGKGSRETRGSRRFSEPPSTSTSRNASSTRCFSTKPGCATATLCALCRASSRRSSSAGVASGAFEVDDVAFTTEFLLHGLHGALVSYLHHPKASRTRFVRSCLGVCDELLGVQ